jgi:hypothetical protein
MSTEAGVGMSYHRNPRMAGREAVEQTLKSGGVEKPDFVFMFATAGYDQQALVEAVREATGGAPLCGCSGGGVIAGYEADESNFSVAVMAISSDELRFKNGIAIGLKEDSTGVGCAIANAVKPELHVDALALFLFPDGLTVNFERLQVGLEEHLKLDRLLPLVGGTAGDNFEFKQTYQYYNDQVVSDGVAWGLLSGQAQIAYAVNHGCISMGIEHQVTRAEGNVIYEIDGKPTMEMLRNYLTDDEIADWGRALQNFPFGFETTGAMRDDYDSYLIRAIMTKDDETGAVTIPTEVSAGTRIWMTRRDYRKIAAGVDRLATQIKEQLGNTPAKLVFQFDCAGRGKVILRNQQRLQLLKTLRQQIGPDVPWLGVYTFGEIGPVGEHNYFHNFTAVVTAIY